MRSSTLKRRGSILKTWAKASTCSLSNEIWITLPDLLPSSLVLRNSQGAIGMLLLLDDDLDKRNRIDSILLGALAKHGLGEVESAVRNLQQLNAEDPNHLLVAEMLGWIQSGGGAVPERPEVESAS